MIRKEAYVHKSVIEELKRIIDESEVMQEDDALWPPPDRVGRQVWKHQDLNLFDSLIRMHIYNNRNKSSESSLLNIVSSLREIRGCLSFLYPLHCTQVT